MAENEIVLYFTDAVPGCAFCGGVGIINGPYAAFVCSCRKLKKKVVVHETRR